MHNLTKSTEDAALRIGYAYPKMFVEGLVAIGPCGLDRSSGRSLNG
jgi:hypothetical protein